MKNIDNIYLIIILVSLLVILLNFITEGFSSLHNMLEDFSNPPNISNNKNITDKDIEDIMGESISPAIEDISYMDEIENKDLIIRDFYPSPNLVNKKSKKEITEFAFSTDLFHQILPIYNKGYIGLVLFDKRINGLYYTEKLEDKKWQLIPNSIPKGMKGSVFLTYDRDRKLLGIFEEENVGEYILSKYHLYKKKNLGLGCEWEHIEKSRIKSIIFDKDDKLIGLDLKGNFYKKTNKNLNSEWNKIDLNFEHIPMRKLIFQNNSNIMLGLGNDFRIYRKQFSDWENSEWSEPTKKSLLGSVRDIFYDYDNKLCGLSRIGLVKQNEITYQSEFKIYKKLDEKVLNNEQVLYSITGIENLPIYNNNENNINEIIIEGKKLSDYKFKDPKLNEFIKFRMNLKKQCNKIKNIKLKDETNIKDDDEVRNQKFQQNLNQQKDTIDNLLDTIESLKKKSFQE